MHFAVKGRGLAPEKLERAIAPSVEKYGSALAMIASGKYPLVRVKSRGRLSGLDELRSMQRDICMRHGGEVVCEVHVLPDTLTARARTTRPASCFCAALR